MLSSIARRMQKSGPLHPPLSVGGNVDAEPINQSPLPKKRREWGDAGHGACPDHASDSQRPQGQPATGPELDKQRIEGGGTQTKSGGQTLPTKMPRIDSDDFYDPISDRFWNGIWNATAAHNVSSIPLHSFQAESSYRRRKYIAKFSMPFLTITSRHGSSTRSTLSTMNASTNLWV